MLAEIKQSTQEEIASIKKTGNITIGAIEIDPKHREMTDQILATIEETGFATMFVQSSAYPGGITRFEINCISADLAQRNKTLACSIFEVANSNEAKVVFTSPKEE